MLSFPQKEQRVLTFRHFSRKGYALFACLGREVRIGVLSAATLATAAPRLAAQTPAIGQERPVSTEQPDDTRPLGEAVVAASRAPLAADVAARQVMTLNRRDLAAAGVTSINDALKLAASVDVRQRGALGVQTDVSIEGSTFDQITLLINGVPVNNPQTGHNAADFPVNLSDVERIEVLPGAASRVLGSQAFAGAINVVTRQGGSRLRLEGQGGSKGTAAFEARTAWRPVAGLTTSASGSFGRSDGLTPNADFIGGKAYWQARYANEALQLDAQAGVSVRDFGANTFYSAAYPDQWEATRRYLLSVRAETRGRVHLAPQCSWLRSQDHYQLQRGTPTGENFNRSDVLSLGLNAWTQWAWGRTALGAELRDETLYSTNLGRPMPEDEVFKVGGRHGVRYSREAQRTNVSYFLEHNVLLRRWTISAGVMLQHNSAAGRGFGCYPGVDVSYRPATGWRLYASWNRSMRLPTFTDLWYKSPTQEGNTGLRPEHNSAFRLGADYAARVVRLSAHAYYNRGTDLIDWVMLRPDDVYHAANFQLDNYGAGLSATVDLKAWAPRQPFERFSASYAWGHQHRRRGAPYFKSNYAMEYLRHQLVATLSHRLVAALGMDWTLRVQDRAGGYIAYRGGQASGALQPYGAHALLDCKVHWTQRRYRLFVDLTNLTATRYYDVGNVRQPGFAAMAGAMWQW